MVKKFIIYKEKKYNNVMNKAINIILKLVLDQNQKINQETLEKILSTL